MEKKALFEKLQETVLTLQQQKPLVLNLTNYVTMDFMANCLLALGAAPIMSEEGSELAELIAIADTINLNLGTLNHPFLERIEILKKQASALKKPLILDPVGAGATHLRSTVAKAWLPYCSIVRGNASEIMALHSDNEALAPLGVEATCSTQRAAHAVQALSIQYQRTVVVSGEIDRIYDAQQTVTLAYGNALMSKVTGMGCTLTAVIAAFHAVCPQPFQAALLATLYFGLCGEQASQQSALPGSFRSYFIDTLFSPNWNTIQTRLC